jgi:predicted phage terminase large subunit-like protein
MDEYNDEELAALVKALSPDEIEELLEGLPDPAARALLNVIPASRDDLPATALAQALELDDGYRVRAHLEYLSERLAKSVEDVENGQSRNLVISMPPRMGKSTLASQYLQVWLLRQHPEWKIGMISHDSSLAVTWGRAVRRFAENRPELGIRIAPDAGAAQEWETREHGGILARSVGGSITGRGFKVLLIDDPVKDFVTAHSEVFRKNLWEWWLSTAQTRLEPPSLTIVIGCLTADARVLMADGTQRRIEDVRPGDLVATYEDGRLAESVVNNWANQGPDHVYSVRMASGRVVRANARHPFLTVDENGVETWQRTDNLKPGDAILTATGVSGEGSPAQRTSATGQSAPRGCASRTTTKPDGLQVTTGSPLSSSAGHTCGTDTGSTPRTSTPSSTLREESARSADESPTSRTPEDEECCSSITATTANGFEGCCATTATSSSDTEPLSSGFSAPLSTYALASDKIESIVLDGYEDVFDIEVDRTHNFVANGLVTHNTRWHEDDFIGRLLSEDHEGDPDEWEVISFPALADEESDVLGRERDEPLISPLIEETPEEASQRWAKVKKDVGSYTWDALYQQKPSAPKGSIFDVGWWRYWTTDPRKVSDDGRIVLFDPDDHSGTWVESWDCAFKDTKTSDYVVGQRWVRREAQIFLTQQVRGRWSFTKTLPQMEAFSAPWVAARLVEDKANGTAILDTLRRRLTGLIPINPREGKEARARAISPLVEAGNVHLPHPSEPGCEWVTDLITETRNFPTGAHDDQVDAMSQALFRLRLAEVTRKTRSPNAMGRRVPSRAVNGSMRYSTGPR